MSQQAALLTLQQVTYSGPPIGSSFMMTIVASGETTVIPLNFMPGQFLNFSEIVTAVQADVVGAGSFNVTTSFTGSGPMGPVNGSGTTTMALPPGSTGQDFITTVTVGPSQGPSANFIIRYHAVFRDPPVCYDPEWLCRMRYNYPAFQYWWCLGVSQLPDFPTIQPVLDMVSTLDSFTMGLQAINSQLGLGYTQASSAFLDRIDYTMNVSLAAGPSVGTLSLRRQYQISDFTEAVNVRAGDFIGVVSDRLYVPTLDLCRRWRQLLDCYCRLCRLWVSLPVTAQNLFNEQAAPVIGSAYPVFVSQAQTVSLPIRFTPSPTTSCDKLLDIVSFWAWWCKICPLLSYPSFELAIQPYYDSLYLTRGQIQALLDASNMTICQPPMGDFCDDWLDILSCLDKLCSHSGDLPTSVWNDLTSTFSATITAAAKACYKPSVGTLLPSPSSFCDLVRWLKNYFTTICGDKVVPGGPSQRQILDNLLATLQSEMNGFKARNGDLCATTVPMDHCTDWLLVIDCLQRLCGKRGEMTDGMQSDFSSAFSTSVGSLYALIPHPVPPENPPVPGPNGLDLLCWKLQRVYNYLHSICPSGSIDPILRLKIDALLSTFQSEYNAFLAQYPSICSTTTTVTTSFCNDWSTILNCLRRICDRRNRLYPGIMDEVVAQFGDLVDFLYWLFTQPTQYYPGFTATSGDDLCTKLSRLQDELNTLCANHVTDPVRKYRLEQELINFQQAYAALLLIYPDICRAQDVDPFCDDWVRMLDCLAKLCDRRSELPHDSGGNSTILTSIANDLGPIIDICYQGVFGVLSGSFPTQLDRVSYQIHGLLGWFGDHCGCGTSIGSSVYALLAGELPAMHLYYDAIELCHCECLTTKLDVTTGKAKWMVTSPKDGITTQILANIVTGTHHIGTPISGSDWISPLPTAADSTTGSIYYEYCFCLCGDADLHFHWEFYADDYVEFKLDGVLLQASVQSVMTHSETLDITRHVTSGRHCIQANVQNNPADNSALGIAGYIEDLSRHLSQDACCGGGTLPQLDSTAVTICCDVDPSCDKLTSLPLFMQLLCGPPRAAGDPFYSLAPIASISSLISQFESAMQVNLVLELGLDPNATHADGSSFCDRLEFMLRLMILGYSNLGALPVLRRYQLDCYYTSLQAQIWIYAAIAESDALSCASCYGLFGKWMSMLNCLCRLCANRKVLVQQGLSSTFDSIICDDITGTTGLYNYVLSLASGSNVMIYPATAPVDCCDQIRRVVTFFALLGLECDEISGSTVTALQGRYDAIYPEFVRLQSALAPANLGICDDFCQRWTSVLECLFAFCLRRPELSQAQRARFDTLAGPQIALLHAAVPGSSVPTSPFPSAVFGDLCYGLYEVLMEFYHRCTPYYSWSTGLRAQLEGLYLPFKAVVDTLKGEFAGTGIHFCDESMSVCDRIRTLADNYRLFCTTTPNGSAAPVAAVDTLLGQISSVVPLLQNRLNLALTAYPALSSFCVRLEFMVDLAAVAYSRVDELTPGLRLTVELFYRVLSSQAAIYKTSLGGNLPPVTAISRFRQAWLDPLLCLCNVCAQLPTLPAGISTLIQGSLGTHVQTIYDLSLSYASMAGLPMVALPCSLGTPVPATTRCKQIRMLLGFFATFGLRYAESPNGSYTTAMNALNAQLPNLRTDVVALRAALAAIGQVICSEEDYNAVAVQSRSIYLQAAGSDGTDHTVPGVDLRWKFTGDLEKHIPKGNLAAPDGPYPADYGYNKPDDFVRIYRVPYTDTFPAIIDFTTMKPTDITTPAQWLSNKSVQWTFSGLQPDTLFTTPTTSLTIVFRNAATYHTVCGSRQPKTNAADVLYIMQNYHDLIEIWSANKPAFSVAFDIVAAGSVSLKMEGIAFDYKGFDRRQILTCRHQITSAGRQTVVSEGMETIRFQYQGCYISAVRVETYQDFYVATKRRYAWDHVGDFGLSVDQTEVYNRLENTAHFTVHDVWPRFASPLFTPVSQLECRVNVGNYKDRWDPNPTYKGRSNADGLKEGVEYYLSTSMDSSGWEANRTFDSADSNDDSQVTLSMLRMLNLVALDFHVARMLGWGHIDWEVAQTPFPAGQRYIYLAEYETPSRPGMVGILHRYLSLPTGAVVNDQRLPVTPEILDYTLGLPKYDDQTPKFTDDNGYTKYGDSRFIQFNRNDFQFDLPADGTFWAGSSQFGRGENTRPIFFGIRRRELSSGVYGPWIVPDISNDAGEYASPTYQPYLDTAGQPEVIPIPDQDNPIFTEHLVKERDNHKTYNYGIYSINWFSRVSNIAPYVDPLNNAPKDIVNDFPKRNTILPPLNLTAQFIQQEPRLMFNSSYEQSTTLLHDTTRVTLDWTHVHNLAYDRATHVKFFFRTDPPLAIKGEIDRVDKGPDATSLYIYTRSYKDPSTGDLNGGTVVMPSIAGTPARFKGSLLVTQSHRFLIEDVSVYGSDHLALFTVRMEYAEPSDNPQADEVDPTIPKGGGWYGPSIGDRFMAVENLADPANLWTELHQSDLPLPDITASPYNVAAYTEPGTDPNGNAITLHVGGIGRSAHIQEVFDGGPTGVYQITFDVGGNFTLHPYAETLPSGIQAAEWYKGVVRIAEANHADKIKVLDVIKIVTPTNPDDPTTPVTPLTIYAIDPAIDDTDHLIIPRVQGSTVAKTVNFHPGLRAYLKLATNGINLATDVLPQSGAKVRQTYIAANAYEQSTTNVSPLTAPVVHIARLFDAPSVPKPPVGLFHATRPDVYGKATYTYDTEIDQSTHSPVGFPYSMVFYRANELMLLRALYTQATIDSVILPSLPTRDQEGSSLHAQRWMGLVNVDTEPSGVNAGEFLAYGSSSFRFPHPDNPDTAILDRSHPGQTRQPFHGGAVVPGSAVQDVRDVIRQAFLPLTERPVVLDLVKRDDNLQTFGGKPVVRDDNGELLAHSDSRFDAFPMVRKGLVTSSGKWFVRFTDYTLDGAARNFYFYYAREIAASLVASEPGPVIGPVRLIDSSPAPTPVIKHVISQPADPVLGISAQVQIEVAKFQENDNVTKIRLYRALAPEDALSMLTMTAVGDTDLPGGSPDSYLVIDAFDGVTPPYGQAVYYRLAALRSIVNEQEVEELVPSLLSKTVIVTVIDSVNPPAPQLSYTSGTPVGNPVQELPSVVLSWNQTAVRGTYYLYQMTPKGNWQRIDAITPDPTLPNAAVTKAVGTLSKQDADGNTIYNRFKVVAQNSSGLQSLTDNVLMI